MYEEGVLSIPKATLRVIKAPLTVTADDKTYYTGSDDFPLLSMTFAGFKNGNTEEKIEQWALHLVRC